MKPVFQWPEAMRYYREGRKLCRVWAKQVFCTFANVEFRIVDLQFEKMLLKLLECNFKGIVSSLVCAKLLQKYFIYS